MALKNELEIIDGLQPEWKVNTGQLIKEIVDCTGKDGAALSVPLKIFRATLTQVSKRASQLNDPVLNALMCRLALYGAADPYDKENYNADIVTKCLNHPDYIKFKQS